MSIHVCVYKHSHNRHLSLSLDLFLPRSVHASAPWPFEKHWPFTAATDRGWWSAWRVVVRQVGLISLWASWWCATLQEIRLWACKAWSQALTFLSWGKEKHQLSWGDPLRMRMCCYILLGGHVYYKCLCLYTLSTSPRRTENELCCFIYNAVVG